MQFKDIIGQQRLKQSLVHSIDSGRVSHAQLFTGTAGRGVLAMAVAYLQYLSCERRCDGDSCGECPTCQKIASLTHPDLHLVFPVNKQGKKSGEVVKSDEFVGLFRELFVQNNGYISPQMWYEKLDLGKTLKGLISAREADEIVRKLSFKSYEGGYKMMLIWLPEMMNDEAANKILKILEEPWQGTVFILVAEREDWLLPTIISRTQQVAVPRIENEILAQIAIERGVADSEQAERIARLSGGDLLELQQILGSEQSSQRKETFDAFCSLMRLSYTDSHLELFEWAELQAQLRRDEQREFLLNAARLLRESYILSAKVDKISYLWSEEQQFCSKFAPFIDSHNIEALIEQIESALAQVAQNGNSTIIFTHFALAVSKLIRRV